MLKSVAQTYQNRRICIANQCKSGSPRISLVYIVREVIKVNRENANSGSGVPPHPSQPLVCTMSIGVISNGVETNSGIKNSSQGSGRINFPDHNYCVSDGTISNGIVSSDLISDSGITNSSQGNGRIDFPDHNYCVSDGTNDVQIVA